MSTVTRTIKILGLVSIAFVVLMSVYIVPRFMRRQKRARLTTEAPAVVTSVDVTSYKPRRSITTSTRSTVKYTYAVGGKNFEGETKVDFAVNFQPGDRRKVCYDPSRPEESEILAVYSTCQQMANLSR